MPGPIPKPAAIRQRRNKHSTAAVLPSIETAKDRRIPNLPPRESAAEIWHPKVVAWWSEYWTSPMAPEILESDKVGGLYLLAELWQAFWTERDVAMRLKLAAEIRQQGVRYGDSPIDRRRLQWEIEKGDKAEETVKRRRKQRQLDVVEKKDPRDVLKVV